MPIFLSGPMGAGKSTIARALAERRGVPAVDLDASIEARSGATVADLFARRGERAFRELERAEALAAVGSEDAVVALGGGTVTDDRTRAALLGAGTLITLTAPVDELARRVGDGAGRPLLAGVDVARVLTELTIARADAYAECHGVVSTHGSTLDETLGAIEAIERDAPVLVPLGTRSYRVEIGAGVRRRLPQRLDGVSELFLTTDEGARPWAEDVLARLRDAGREAHLFEQPRGERFKTVETVEGIWDAALAAGADRRSTLVAVSGGVVGDLTGFAAATLLRGVGFGQVPTTLLAMVDSSVGGKTGFNRRAGKNLVGAFHQPGFVLCDVETLSTLPVVERIAGLAEVFKSAWLAGEAEVAALEEDAELLRAGDAAATTRAIRMAVTLKAKIVSEDEREAGRRMLLNLGHTLGHALEAAGEYQALRHGEGVALGIVAAFRLAAARGADVSAPAERAERLLRNLGLPTDVDHRLDARTLAFVGSDKKRVGDTVNFIVPSTPGATRVEPIRVREIEAALG